MSYMPPCISFGRVSDLNLPVEKGRHTETKKQNRGNVKQHTGKVQN
jgi:hypothetical protein